MIAHAIHLIGNAGQCGIEIERTAVMLWLGVRAVLEGKVQIAEHLITAIGHLRSAAAAGTGTTADQVAVRQGLGFAVFPLEEQLADFRQHFQGLGIVGILRRAGPQRVLVELDALGDHVPEDHRPEAAVAHGCGLVPFACRLALPDGEFFGSRG